MLLSSSEPAALPPLRAPPSLRADQKPAGCLPAGLARTSVCSLLIFSSWSPDPIADPRPTLTVLFALSSAAPASHVASRGRKRPDSGKQVSDRLVAPASRLKNCSKKLCDLRNSVIFSCFTARTTADCCFPSFQGFELAPGILLSAVSKRALLLHERHGWKCISERMSPLFVGMGRLGNF